MAGLDPAIQSLPGDLWMAGSGAGHEGGEDCLLPIAYCLLPIAYCLLPIAYCLSSLVDKITADSVRVTPAMAPIWSSS
jgi:hypothetical protein